MTQFDDTFSPEKMDEMRSKEEESLIRSLSLRYGYQFVNLTTVTINPEAIHSIPEDVARTGFIIAFEKNNKKLSVAIRNPNNPVTKTIMKDLESQGLTLQIFMTSTASLEHGWKRYHDYKDTAEVQRGVLDINPENIARQLPLYKNIEFVAEHIVQIRTLNSARRVSETLESLFAGAIALGVSDIHIEPEETGIRVRYRLDGVLQDVMHLERTIYERIISRLKLLAGMILNIKDEAQDGRFSFSIVEKDIEVRASVIPGSSGESMVMRLLDPSVASFSLPTLGLNDIMLKVMNEELKRPNGLIITTGPTGSGKTTALYAFLRETHKPGVKIITIEDPVEYKVGEIVQTQVGDDYTFASGLRSILRQDPDIIMVGEIRDSEVAETTIHAAQTGHLVFSTLHTNSAVGAFPRLIDIGVDARLIGSSVNVIIGQRLVRKLCEHCKTAYSATEAEFSLISKILHTHPKPPPIEAGLTLYKAKGCDRCNFSGYKGRQGVYEAILMDEKVEEAVINDPREHVILEAAISQGIPTMPEDGIERVVKGETSLEELRRVVDLRAGRHNHKENNDSSIDDNLPDMNAHIV
ncbi:type II/IV secretion system protein [Candidatus Kaiserbacteria bacterium]|nr:type II/IV secretion system protein [Candidatus Kaiserbacteria bacterium]